LGNNRAHKLGEANADECDPSEGIVTTLIYWRQRWLRIGELQNRTISMISVMHKDGGRKGLRLDNLVGVGCQIL